MWTIARVAHVEYARQQHIGRVERRHADHDGPEPANLPLAAARGCGPMASAGRPPAIVDESEALSFGIFEQQGETAISLDDLAVAHALFVEAVRPPRQRVVAAHAQARPDDAARAPPLTRNRPVEEREVGARAAFRVGVEEMVGADVILIHRALDQPHTESLSVEAMILLDGGRDRREVMNACEFHGSLSSETKALGVSRRTAPPLAFSFSVTQADDHAVMEYTRLDVPESVPAVFVEA